MTSTLSFWTAHFCVHTCIIQKSYNTSLMIQIVSCLPAFSWLNICFSKSKLTDHDYILLSRGLKFIPNPKDKNAKLELLKDF